jgi:hypothetical protein
MQWDYSENISVGWYLIDEKIMENPFSISLFDYLN